MNILIMAASRKGVEDSVAAMQNKSHKCLVTIDGEAMLTRVIQSCLDSGLAGQIYISIESEEPLRTVPRLSDWLDDGTIKVTPSRGNLADSVLAAVEHMDTPFPLMITTGDNVLHHGALIFDFITQFKKGSADVAVAFTEATVVRLEAPDVKLAYHRLKDGEFSACNLYGLRNENALKAIRIFESGGQFGKRHLRILKAFGIMPFIYYKFRLLGIDALMHKIARNLGVTVDVLMMDYPEGPIDVDNPEFYAIAERMLKSRVQQV
ncbi:MAG: NTP transferase domain-containing protein [Sphingomonadales bacterium]|jgi:GTP:adenosylcobinamide-phosphate guanylyltransferase